MIGLYGSSFVGTGGRGPSRTASPSNLVKIAVANPAMDRVATDTQLPRQQIVDAPDKIEAFLPELDQMVTEGLVTVERAEVVMYRGPAKPRT